MPRMRSTTPYAIGGPMVLRVDEDLDLGGALGGAIDHRLAVAQHRISEPSGATVTLSGSECGSVVTTNSDSAAAAANEKALRRGKKKDVSWLPLTWQ
jgi:hypothetical protein